MADRMDATSQAFNDTLAELGAALDADHQADVVDTTCRTCQLKAEKIPDPQHRPEPAQVPAAREWLARR